VLSKQRILVALLLSAAAVVFAIGVALERSQPDHHDEPTTQGERLNATEGSEEREAAERRERTQTAESSESNTEELFGVNTESTALVVAAVAVSLLLAAAVLAVRSAVIVPLIVVVALGAAVFDVREVVHQIDESRSGVATLAALTAALHFLTVLLAAWCVLAERRDAGGQGLRVSRSD
jgi:Flp pilus assembly protein TadB